MAAENKSIIIASKKNAPGTLYKWKAMGDFMKEFTSSIDATFSSGELGKNLNISQAVSGLPSAYARSSMFSYAMKSTASDGQGTGLNAFYGSLIDEWKGFIASFVFLLINSLVCFDGAVNPSPPEVLLSKIPVSKSFLPNIRI